MKLKIKLASSKNDLENVLKIRKRVFIKEQQIPTSIEIDELTCVLGFSKSGIDFNSPDGQLCHIILLTLSSQKDPCEHRKFITRFRTMINNPNIRTKLLEVNKSKEVIKIIQEWEDEDLSGYIN